MRDSQWCQNFLLNIEKSRKKIRDISPGHKYKKEKLFSPHSYRV